MGKHVNNNQKTKYGQNQRSEIPFEAFDSVKGEMVMIQPFVDTRTHGIARFCDPDCIAFEIDHNMAKIPRAERDRKTKYRMTHDEKAPFCQINHCQIGAVAKTNDDPKNPNKSKYYYGRIYRRLNEES